MTAPILPAHSLPRLRLSSYAGFGMLMLLWFSTSSCPGYAQEASFISYNYDTFIGQAMACSPDGKHVYAAGLHTIAIFQRSLEDTLIAVQILNNDYLGVHGIHNVIDLALSPDGRHLYAVNENDQSLLRFVRDSGTGRISLEEVMVDSVFGNYRGDVPFLETYYRLLLTHEGRTLFWLSQFYRLLAVFSRNPDTGQVTKTQVLRPGDAELRSLEIPYYISVSPDGHHLYAIGGNGSKILLFEYDSQTGRLAYKSYYDSGPFPTGRWDGGSIVVAPDGETVYATHWFDGKVFVLTRDRQSGALSLVQSLALHSPRGVLVSPESKRVYIRHFDQGGAFSTYEVDANTQQLNLVDNFMTQFGFQSAAGVCMSPQGDAIYTTTASARAVIQIDEHTGKLALLQHFGNNIGGTDRLGGAHLVEASPDGHFLYVGTFRGGSYDHDEGLSLFSRDQANGRLTLVKSYPLPEVSAMEFAPNGFLYLATTHNEPFLIYSRDTQTGELQLAGMEADSSGAGWRRPLIFSPEGTQLYAMIHNQLKVYAVDLATNKLTLLQTLRLREHGIYELTAMALSPDGVHLYCGDSYAIPDPQIFIFKRDPGSGLLSFLQPGEPILANSIRNIKISPDGRHVYLMLWDCADSGANILAFARDPHSGDLAFAQNLNFSDWCYAVDLIFAANGIDVYATIDDYSDFSGLVLMLERDPMTGELTQRKAFQSWKEGVYGLYEPRDLALSPDGNYLYVTDQYGVATFATGRGNSTAVTNHNPAATLPRTLSLQQNYPNPFSAYGAAATVIPYDIPVNPGGATHAELAIYNLQGRLVRRFVQGEKMPGRYEVKWDGRLADGRRVPAGAYFYRLKTAGNVVTKKMIVLQ